MVEQIIITLATMLALSVAIVAVIITQKDRDHGRT